MKRFILFLLILFLVSCAEVAQKGDKTSNAKSNCDCPKIKTEKEDLAKIPDYGLLRKSDWSAIESSFESDNVLLTWTAWLRSCSVLKQKDTWKKVCDLADDIKEPSDENIKNYFKKYFNLYSATNMDGSDTGTITGYYQPILKGSKVKTSHYKVPLYTTPKDLITVDLSDVYPELKSKRLRGKLAGNKLIPYLSRAEIDGQGSPLAGNEIVWVEDPVEAFFLEIQGSGIIQFDNGEAMQIGYADQNGYPFKAIGSTLVQKKEITMAEASMEGIKNWARKNITKLREFLNMNASYVFFRKLPNDLPGPIGALGVSIEAERSVAIDPKFIPLGAPVFLSTTQPNASEPLERLMVAQDTGGAIRGGVRADFYWGSGDEAGRKAGSMKQQGKIWTLLPRDYEFPKATQEFVMKRNRIEEASK
ncbi:murein transglycosylase [Candidatus Methylopumilus rimovensis]|uniref:peptidoglycan lytic exotransglycosylase n=1 Tax=Candidatus Methylopumilus rimovensis TaxID=2588535 RepID=A0AAE6FS62_9PROT|nr:MltA domain-containing protein [Candidatus Methylopumilus rimovensis]QDD12984.1 murein transglycosylase [Candidatus Methylopumilus rimovensis]